VIKPLPRVLFVSFASQHRYVKTLVWAFSGVNKCHWLLSFFVNGDGLKANQKRGGFVRPHNQKPR